MAFATAAEAKMNLFAVHTHSPLFVYVVVAVLVPQVLYVVRSPHPPSGFVETVVYSDRGGLQCPEPLLPVSRAASTAHRRIWGSRLTSYIYIYIYTSVSEKY